MQHYAHGERNITFTVSEEKRDILTAGRSNSGSFEQSGGLRPPADGLSARDIREEHRDTGIETPPCSQDQESLVEYIELTPRFIDRNPKPKATPASSPLPPKLDWSDRSSLFGPKEDAPDAALAASLASGRTADDADDEEPLPDPWSQEKPLEAHQVEPAPVPARGDKEYDKFVKAYNYVAWKIRLDGYRVGPGTNQDEWIRYIDSKNEAKVWNAWKIETRLQRAWWDVLEKFTRSNYLMGLICSNIHDGTKFFAMNPVTFIRKLDEIRSGKYDDRAPVARRLQATAGVIWHCKQEGGDPVETLKAKHLRFNVVSYELPFAVKHLQEMV